MRRFYCLGYVWATVERGMRLLELALGSDAGE